MGGGNNTQDYSWLALLLHLSPSLQRLTSKVLRVARIVLQREREEEEVERLAEPGPEIK